MNKLLHNKANKTKGVADVVDKYVGNQLRVRRSLLGYSQEKLAESAGVTFQQIQKYERGTNRISASRLLTFSKILSVPIYFFYEGLEGEDTPSLSVSGFQEDGQDSFDHAIKKKIEQDLLFNKETIELVRAYYSVQDPKVRKDILKFVKSMAKNMTS